MNRNYSHFVENIIMSQKGAQSIAQKIQSLTDSVNAQGKNVSSILDTLQNMSSVMTAMEHRLGQLETTSKSGGVKRVAKSGATSSKTTTTTAPVGKKFAISSFVWLGQKFKTDEVETLIAKYFSEDHTTRVTTALEAIPDYVKATTGLAAATTDKDKLTHSKKIATLRFRAYWAIVKKDPSIKNKIDQDWSAEKSVHEKSNQTPAKTDEGAPTDAADEPTDAETTDAETSS